MQTPEEAGVVRLGAVDDFSAAYPELYTNHVAIAACIRAWADGMSGQLPARDVCNEDDYLLGYTRALRDMAGLLMDGDGLPDGPLFPVARTA